MANTLKFGNGQWATGNGTALAYNDENSNFKPLPFNFTRASSGTTVNQSGLIETVGSGIPRIDFQGNTKGALLLEPSRTNVITYSEDYSQSAWIKNSTGTGTNPTLDFGYTSPDGSLNATKIIFNIGAGSSAADLSLLKTAITTIDGVATIYLKGDTGGEDISFLAGNTRQNIILTNSWKRYTLSNASLFQLTLRLRGDQNTNNSCTIYVWGAQAEAGSYATSYIPTSGSAVTRVADVCSNGGNDQSISSEQGCFYFEGNVFKGDDTVNIISITDASVNNYIYLNFQTNTNQEKVRYTVSGSTQINYNFPSSETMYANSKYAISYKTNEIKVYRNGVEIITDTNAVMLSPNTLNKIQFSFNNTNYFKGYIKDLKLYNTALTDNELAALTQV